MYSGSHDIVLIFNRYTQAVDEFLDGIEEKCEAIKPSLAETDKQGCDEYLVTIKLLRYLVNWAEVVVTGGVSGMEDVDEQTGSEVELLADAISEKNEEIIRANLKWVNFELNEPSSVAWVTQQPGLRIEQVSKLVIVFPFSFSF